MTFCMTFANLPRTRTRTQHIRCSHTYTAITYICPSCPELNLSPLRLQVKDKMLYAATKATVKKSFSSGLIDVDIAATHKVQCRSIPRSYRDAFLVLIIIAPLKRVCTIHVQYCTLILLKSKACKNAKSTELQVIVST